MKFALTSLSKIKREAVEEVLNEVLKGREYVLDCVKTETNLPQPIGEALAKECIKERIEWVDDLMAYDVIISIENFIDPESLKDRVCVNTFTPHDGVSNYTVSEGTELPFPELFKGSSHTTYGELLCSAYPQYNPPDNWMKHVSPQLGGGDRKELIKEQLRRLL